MHRAEAALVPASLLREEDRLRFDVTDAPEFDRWKWADYWSPVREVIHFKRGVYARALEELGVHASPTAAGAGSNGGRTTDAEPARAAVLGMAPLARAVGRARRCGDRAWAGRVVHLAPGRLSGGYDSAVVDRERREARVQIDALQRENARLNVQVAELEMARHPDWEAYGQVERTLPSCRLSFLARWRSCLLSQHRLAGRRDPGCASIGLEISPARVRASSSWRLP